MPTPFEEVKSTEWAARSNKPRRSVFGNYSPTEPGSSRREEAPSSNRQSAIGNRQSDQSLIKSAPTSEVGLHGAIDTAVARAFLYQFLARAFEDPTTESWAWLTGVSTHLALQSATRLLTNDANGLQNSAVALVAQFQPDRFESFQVAHVTAFGHAARGDCPLNEIEYGDLKADPLFQPHRLADLAAFYRAFGLEVAEGAAERPDHIGMELEFMSVLAAREAYAHEHQLDDEQRELCRDAQKKFLREHLGRWSPAFARRLVRAATNETLAALAGFTRDFVAAECARFGLQPGSEDLLLRPVDEAAESLCASCGLKDLPPGATATSATT
jgi:DMSO reductase family type II enzyme chaperone